MPVDIETTGVHAFRRAALRRLHVGVAPAWMRVRLALAGQRPIDNVVDVSNYVMLETGQPLHFYDADRISGSSLTFAMRATAKRSDARRRRTQRLRRRPWWLPTSNARSASPGMMGGRDSEVTRQRASIVLEAATFDGARVRRAAKALGLRTEAAARHEKTLPPMLADFGAARAAWLLVRAGATASAPHAYGEAVDDATPIALHPRDVTRLLGFEVPRATHCKRTRIARLSR